VIGKQRLAKISRSAPLESEGLTNVRRLLISILHLLQSFIRSGYLYSASSRNLLRCALSPVTAKEKCLRRL